jgi:hypothetical protein
VVLFKIVYKNLTKWSGKMRWLEKTPTHLFHINYILKEIPDALFVEIVRDVRDVITSKYIRRSSDWISKFDQKKQSLKKLTSGYDPLWDALGWKAAINATTHAKSNNLEKILRIRYEDFVSNPEKQMLFICDFLHLSFNEKMLDIGWVNTTTTTQSSTKVISGDAIGKWKNILPREDAVLCQRVTRSELRFLNYKLERYGLYDYFRMVLILRKSILEFLRRIYRRWRLGGFVYLGNTFKNYWVRLLSLSRS